MLKQPYDRILKYIFSLQQNPYLSKIKPKAPLGNCLYWWRKLEQSFPNAQFHLEHYQLHPFWEDRNSSGGAKLIYAKQALIAKRLESSQTRSAESICNKLIFQIKSCAFFLHLYSKKRAKTCSNKKFQTVFVELLTKMKRCKNARILKCRCAKFKY